MEKHEQAAAAFAQGYNCSQSVLLAFAEELGLSPELAARVAAGFGGGMGRTGSICGAVTGGVMALGLMHGSTNPDDKVAKEHTAAQARAFFEAFRAEHGSLTCEDLLGINIASPEASQRAREQGLFKARCPLFVAGAAKIAEALKP